VKGDVVPTIVGIRKSMFLLSHSKDRVIICLARVSACDRRGQTDGQTEYAWLIQRSALQLASNAVLCGRAVETTIIVIVSIRYDLYYRSMSFPYANCIRHLGSSRICQVCFWINSEMDFR